MRGVSKRIVNAVAVALVVATIATQPVLAAAKAPERGGDFGSIVRKIIRALDTIAIGFPPG